MLGTIPRYNSIPEAEGSLSIELNPMEAVYAAPYDFRTEHPVARYRRPAPRPVINLMSMAERLFSLQRMSAQLAYLGDAAYAQGKYDLEVTLIRTAAEVLTSSREIAAAGCVPSFIERLSRAVKRIELGLDTNGALLKQSIAH